MKRILVGACRCIAALVFTAGLGARPAAAQNRMSAASSVQPAGEARLVREVRHELVMLPYYGVFDNLEFRVAGSTVTLLGQVTYWNCFGLDRAAAALYFVAPTPIREALLGKNIASLVFIYLEVLILVLATALLRVLPGWRSVAEMLVVVGVCSLYMLALGNLSSVNYPRALSPERSTQSASSGRFQGLIFLLYPVTLLPVFLAYLARYALNSQLAFVLTLALAAVIGGVLYGIAMESAAHTANQRRETILAELSRG